MEVLPRDAAQRAADRVGLATEDSPDFFQGPAFLPQPLRFLDLLRRQRSRVVGLPTPIPP